jgi:antitoxin (DNA-binding transcriptional repressor) of toxin-antitoxin stability system
VESGEQPNFVYICMLVAMKTITVAELRQNPTAALDDVERGETYIITRYRREIGMIVPVQRGRTPVTAEDVAAAFRRTPLTHDWTAELERDRAEITEDPWTRP